MQVQDRYHSFKIMLEEDTENDKKDPNITHKIKSPMFMVEQNFSAFIPKYKKNVTLIALNSRPFP